MTDSLKGIGDVRLQSSHEYFEKQRASVGLEAVRFVVIVVMIRVGMTVMMVVTSATKKQNAATLSGPNDSRSSLVSNQQRN